MNPWMKWGIPAGAALLLVSVFLKARDSAVPHPVHPKAAIARESRQVQEQFAAAQAPPSPQGFSLERMISGAVAGEPPGGIPSGTPFGPCKVSGSTGGLEALKDLALNPSQRVLIGTILAERDLRLDEIRQEIGSGRLSAETGKRLASQAESAQASCLASIRSALLPDQQVPYDELVHSGRFGGYTLVIPLKR